jgi:hypothetical protein
MKLAVVIVPYGRTPLSSLRAAKLASRCNVRGEVVGDPRRLDAVRAGQAVSVEKA